VGSRRVGFKVRVCYYRMCMIVMLNRLPIQARHIFIFLSALEIIMIRALYYAILYYLNTIN
jgi:hypothetical protein